MHIGNARGGAIGDCLAEIMKWAGYDVQREFYVNDAGNQIEKFGKSLNLRFMQICNGKGQAVIEKCGGNIQDICETIYNDSESFPMPEDVYLGMDIIEHAYNYFKENGSSLSSENEDIRKKHLRLSLFRKILPDWNVTFQSTALHMITGLRKVLFIMTVQSMKLSKNSRQADIHMNKTALYGSNPLN